MSYQDYLRSKHWLSVKKRFKAKECEVCGSLSCLHLHHFNYDNLGTETIEDVATLCNSCHLAAHTWYKAGSQHWLKRNKPSKAIMKLVRKFRQGKGLSQGQMAEFLRRKWMAIFGDKDVPKFKVFRKLACGNRKKVGRRYIYRFPKKLWKDYVEMKNYPRSVNLTAA